MSLITKAAFRFLDAYEEEDRCWNIYDSPFIHRGGSRGVTITDDLRWRRFFPKRGLSVMNDYTVTRIEFKTRGEGLRYIKILCIEAGLRHVLCFWRKDPKLYE